MRNSTPEMDAVLTRLYKAAQEFNRTVAEAYGLGLRIEIEATGDEWVYLERSDSLIPAERLLSNHPDIRVTAVEVVCKRRHADA
jgi:hypothetical protein